MEESLVNDSSSCLRFLYEKETDFSQLYSKLPLESKEKYQIDLFISFIRIKEELIKRKFFFFDLKIAPLNYYEQSLDWRAYFLGANSPEYLCKTLILKNKNFDE